MFLKINTLFYWVNSDINLYIQILNTTLTNNIADENLISTFINSSLHSYLLWYYEIVLNTIILNNVGVFLLTINSTKILKFPLLVFSVIKYLLKLIWVLYMLLIIFFLTTLENFVKQFNSINAISHIAILNNNEKEVGPADDYYLFAVLFFLTISIFIFSAIFFIIIQSNIILWAIGGFFLLTILILTIPVNLFIDFGIMLCTAVRGSASGNNFVKELVFDIISITTVFIRFVIQNIRFFFIFSGIFELLEWTISNNSSLFLSLYYNQTNLFINTNYTNITMSSLNCLIINSILFVLLYLYYLLHLLFLLLVQVTVYLGISIWLFFFLYSTKFLTKFEKYLLFKKQ